MNTSDPLKNLKVPLVQQPKSINYIKPQARAKEMYRFVLDQYRYQKAGLKSDQFINLVCTVGGVEYEVYTVGATEEILIIDTEIEGFLRRMFCTVEEVSFAIILSKKTSDKPPREIGFHAIEEERKKSAE